MAQVGRARRRVCPAFSLRSALLQAGRSLKPPPRLSLPGRIGSVARPLRRQPVSASPRPFFFGAARTMQKEPGREGAPAWLALLLLALAPAALCGENTELPTLSATGGFHSVLEGTVSPAFSATVIIIVTVIISGSAYLCFLKYICTGCCKSSQVVPLRRLEWSKSEEQV